MLCNKCGEEVKKDIKFCSKCGAKLIHEEADATIPKVEKVKENIKKS